jgi:hypothetical protein
VLQAALTLARSGVAVFPCGVDKAPSTSHGFHDATTDADTIRAWSWDGMIGAAITPGTFVLDVDPRNGGADTMALLVSVTRWLPRTRRTRTKSGGSHFWFLVPPDLTLRGSLGPGVDVKRAGKGYVIVPPSPGYVWVVGGAPARAPEWLLEELVVETRANADEAAEPKFFPFEDGTAYGQAALRNALVELADAPEGGRNDALNKIAFGLAQLEAGGELSRAAALERLLTVAESIGLRSAEAMKTIESGWLAGYQIPRQAPKREVTA